MAIKGQFSPQITVEDIIRLALPAETQVIAGETGLGREVTWAVAQHSSPPAFPFLKGGEIALVSVESLRQVYGSLPFSQLIKQLADRGIAAIAVVGEAPIGAENLADSLSVPLLLVPEHINLRELESTISRTITERRTELYKWEMNLHHRFTRISVEGEGVPAIVEALSEITTHPVVFEDDQFTVQFASSDFPSLGLNLPLPRDQAFQEWIKTQELISSDAPIKQFSLPESNLIRLVSPVFVRKRAVGYLSLISKTDFHDEPLLYALSSATSACAMEMARKLAVVEVENRFRGEFLDSLLEGSFHSAEELTTRAATVGYDPSRTYVVAVIRLDSTKNHRSGPSFTDATSSNHIDEVATAIQDELATVTEGFLLRVKDDIVTILLPVQSAEASLTAVEDMIDKARSAAMRMVSMPASAGIGRYHPTYRGIATSFKEAKEALAVAQNFLGGQRSAFFGNLGIYRLLLLLKDTPELQDFYEETLGVLVAYDRKNRTDLVDTLATYFACHGNAENAAEVLYLHRNTLSYRLRRIEQLTNLDLKNIEDSFRLQLALKARNVIPKISGG